MTRSTIANLPQKIAGLYTLQQQNVLVPAFETLCCSIDNVAQEIKSLLQYFQIPPAGVSVRSAATDEDTILQANAGKFLSFNGLSNKKDILSAASIIVEDCFQKSGEKNCNIIIQHTIASVFSGVAFASFDTNEIIVESFFGSCRTVVDGAAMPYRSRCHKGLWQHSSQTDENISIFTVHPFVFDLTDFNNIETGSRLYTSLKHFPGQTRLFSATSDAEIKVYAQIPLHTPYTQQIESLAGIIEKLRDKYPAGIDIEWGIDSLDNLYVFQARHLTRPLNQIVVTTSNEITDDAQITGIPASEGNVSGIIVYENSPASPALNDKRILMLYEATVDNTEKLDEYDGVISVLGGMLCHLAIVCREKSIPCIVGINQMIAEGLYVHIDAKRGVINIEQ